VERASQIVSNANAGQRRFATNLASAGAMSH
jgi:hypothetical protein